MWNEQYWRLYWLFFFVSLVPCHDWFYEIDKGIAGRTPDDKPPFLAIGYFYITDVAEYGKAIAQNIDAIINDFKNYTNVQPVVQINEIKQLVAQHSNGKP